MNTDKIGIAKFNHRKQVFWQIIFPICLTFLFFLIIGIVLAVPNSGNAVQNAKFANISTILLLLPSLVVLAFSLVILSLIIFGVYKLFTIVPVYSQKVLNFFNIISDFVKLWSDRLINPMIFIRSWLAQADNLHSIRNFIDHPKQ
jgi:hypothetical protein